MTKEKALSRVEGYLTDLIPLEDYDEVEEIMKALKEEPCEDTISRKAAIDAIISVDMYDVTASRVYYKQKRIENLRNLPSVQPKIKTGKWMKDYDYKAQGYSLYKCSECGREVIIEIDEEDLYEMYPYCHCGAKMEVER